MAPSIAILALPEASASVIYGMYDLFRGAGRDWSWVVDGRPGAELLAPWVVASGCAPQQIANGVWVRAERGLDHGARYDVVCVPELALAIDADPRGLYPEAAAWLRAQHAAGAIVASACSGAVLLAEAGLLDGCDATTHWAYCDALARTYPRVRVLPERALVVSGEGQRLVMAGGGTSWCDLALYLVARLLDVEAAARLARIHLIEWHHSGQQPFARLARTKQVDDAAVAKAQDWIAKHYAVATPVASMVRLSGLPERTFKRRFRAATGLAPLAYVHALRLEEAKRLLESSDEPLGAVASAVGYEDPAFFARLFRREVQLTPAQYRHKLGGLRRALRAELKAR